MMEVFMDINSPEFPFQMDTTDALYLLLKNEYTEFELTRENSTILKIQGSGTGNKPGRTYLEIKENETNTVHRFYYNRLNVNRWIENPIEVTQEELNQIQDMTRDSEIISFISDKLDIRLESKDFFVEFDRLKLTGGSNPPNWRLKSRYDSPLWYSDLIIHFTVGGSTPVSCVPGIIREEDDRDFEVTFKGDFIDSSLYLTDYGVDDRVVGYIEIGEQNYQRAITLSIREPDVSMLINSGSAAEVLDYNIVVNGQVINDDIDHVDSGVVFYEQRRLLFILYIPDDLDVDDFTNGCFTFSVREWYSDV